MLRVLCLLLTSVANAPQAEKLSYEAAYAKAQQEEKVLLVVVGADWCAACKKLKAATLDPMQRSGKLDCVVMAQIDKDEQPELAKAVMNGSTLPQLVAYQQTPQGDWKRVSLSGLQSESRVTELIRVAAQNNPASAVESTTSTSTVQNADATSQVGAVIESEEIVSQ